MLHTPVASKGKGRSGGGSTDEGDVLDSAYCPDVSRNSAHWLPRAFVATLRFVRQPIGHKGMLVALRPYCALNLVENPGLIQKAWDEFREKTKDSPYKCPFPKGKEFPLDRFFS